MHGGFHPRHHHHQTRSDVLMRNVSLSSMARMRKFAEPRTTRREVLRKSRVESTRRTWSGGSNGSARPVRSVVNNDPEGWVTPCSTPLAVQGGWAPWPLTDRPRDRRRAEMRVQEVDGGNSTRSSSCASRWTATADDIPEHDGAVRMMYYKSNQHGHAPRRAPT